MTEAQPEVQPADLIIGQPVRVFFKGGDRSYREVVWQVTYHDERSAIVKPIHGASHHTPKTRIFDKDDALFIDATTLLEALKAVEKAPEA